MGSKIVVDKSDVLGLNLALAGIRNGVPRVLSTSINKTIKTTQVQATKIIGQVINLPAKRIKSDFKQEKANFSRLSGALIASGQPVGLVNFQARQVKKGVTQKVIRTDSRSLVPGAYIGPGKASTNARDKGARKHVFRRAYRGPKMAVVPGRNYAAMPEKFRLPVSRLTGPRVEDIYARPTVYGKVTSIAADTYAKNVAAETKSLLRRFG